MKGFNMRRGYAPQMGLDLSSVLSSAEGSLQQSASQILPGIEASVAGSLLSDTGVQQQISTAGQSALAQNIVTNKWLYIGGAVAVVLAVYLMAKK
jgi:hypothetical protein